MAVSHLIWFPFLGPFVIFSLYFGLYFLGLELRAERHIWSQASYTFSHRQLQMPKPFKDKLKSNQTSNSLVVIIPLSF